MAVRVFDKYEVLERLAAGGMGEVLLARQIGVSGFERLVILKTLLPEVASDPSFVEQFLDEARLAATLSHPNVVSVFEVGAWNGSYYLAMEYIPGANLAQLQRAAANTKTGLPLALSAELIREAALGLHHAHHAKDLRGNPLSVVHRDISPQNVMVRTDGVTKVVDFGIARAANRASKTKAGAVKGKIAYMAPEQLKGGELDGRTDQYSLGVVLWELCTGRRLYDQSSEGEMVRALLTGTVPLPSSVVPGFPTGLEDVVMRMLAREPGHRYESCYEVAKALEAWLGESKTPPDHQAIAGFLADVGVTGERPLPVTPDKNFVEVLKTEGAPHSSDTTTANQRTPPSPSRRTALWVGLTLLGPAIAAVVVWTWPRPPAPAPAVPPEPVTNRPVATGPEPAAPPLKVADELDAGAPLLAAVPLKHEGPRPPRVTTVAGRPPAEKQPQGQGRLVVRTQPDCVVYLDGAVWGSTPIDRGLPARTYTVDLVNEERGIRERRTVTVKPGGTERLIEEPLRVTGR